MDGRNKEVLSLAFKKAKAMSNKINELGIKPDFTKEQINETIIALAEEKLKDPTWTKSRNDTIKGQRWYVEDLVEFSGLEPQDRLDREYDNSFSDIASEDELVIALAKLSA